MARGNRQRKALIIEDEFIVAEEISSILGRNDMVGIGPASNVKDALRLFQTESPDFLISDIRLHQGTEGLIAVNLINKTAGRAVPVIFITGFQWFKKANINKLFPGSTLVQKPFVEGDLIEAIRALVNGPLNGDVKKNGGATKKNRGRNHQGKPADLAPPDGSDINGGAASGG
jgi:YesN/AraC family two-component response regulator